MAIFVIAASLHSFFLQQLQNEKKTITHFIYILPLLSSDDGGNGDDDKDDDGMAMMAYT